MSNQQHSVQNQSTGLVVFQVDAHSQDKINLVYAQINQYGHFQVTCIKINVQNNTQPTSFTHSTSVQSFWTKTYQSHNDLPKRLFLMKSFPKLIEYFNDSKRRVIQTQQKIKNDKRKLLLNLWVPVTKNITDFVPLELQYIEKDMIHYFFQADKTPFELVHQKILNILEQKNKQKLLEQQKKRIQKQLRQDQLRQQQQREQQLRRKQSQYQTIDDLQQGQMQLHDDVNGLEYYQQNPYLESYIMEDYENWQQNEDSQQMQAFYQEIYQREEERRKKYNPQEECPESQQLLRDEYVESLKQKNQLLLQRVLGLQTQLVKKNVQLQIYEDPFTDLNNIDQVIEKKYQIRVERSYNAINSLMVMFQDLKKSILQNNSINGEESKHQQQQLQQGQMTPKKDAHKIISQMENIFQQFL